MNEKTYKFNSVAAVIYHKKTYLLQHRDNYLNIQSPDYWGLFGGKIKFKEKFQAAIERELMEELKFKPKNIFFLGEIEYKKSISTKNFRSKKFFSINVSKKEIEKFELHEGQQYKFYKINEILSLKKILPWDFYGIFLHHRRISSKLKY